MSDVVEGLGGPHHLKDSEPWESVVPSLNPLSHSTLGVAHGSALAVWVPLEQLELLCSEMGLYWALLTEDTSATPHYQNLAM